MISVVVRRSSIVNKFSARIAARSYHENVIDHYENPRNVGSLDKNKKSVGTGTAALSSCFVMTC